MNQSEKHFKDLLRPVWRWLSWRAFKFKGGHIDLSAANRRQVIIFDQRCQEAHESDRLSSVKHQAWELESRPPPKSPLFLLLLFLKYLFIWLCWVLVVAHGIFVVACGLLSSCGLRAQEHVGSVWSEGSVVAGCGLSSCSTRA